MNKLQVAPVKATIAWSKIHSLSKPTFITNTIYITHCDDVILFRNLLTNEELYYRASGGNKGDGVTALAGHRNLSIFVFSELCVRPSIFVLTYPDFKLVAILKSKHQERYLCMRFSETEHLVALSGLPNYTLELWNWRLGKLLGSVETGVCSPYQVLKSNRSSPLLVGQYAPRLGSLSFWEIHLSTEQALFIKRPTTIPFLTRYVKISFVFGVDNIVYMTDNVGNLHSLIPQTGVTKQLWVCDHFPGPRETQIALHNAGFAIYGSTVSLCYVKKQDNIYIKVWDMPVYIDFAAIRSVNNQLLGFTPDSSTIILEKDEDDEIAKELIEPAEKSDTNIRCFEMIYPIGEYVVIGLGYTRLDLIQCNTGKTVATSKIENIVCARSHPQYPFIAIGDQMGAVTILSYFNPKTPEILTKFILSEAWIDHLEFTPAGEVLVVNDRSGDFFIVTGQIGSQLDVTAHFNFGTPTPCFCAQKVAETLHVLLLAAGEGDLASDKVRRVAVNLKKCDVTETTVPLPDRYTSIVALACGPRQYIGTPHMKRDIHILEMQGDVMTAVEVLPTFNQLPYLEVFSDMNYFVTWGLEGVACIFEVATKKLAAVFFAQSRYSQRVRSVRVDSARRYTVSLGIQGSLKCFQITPNLSQSQLLHENKLHMKSEFMHNLFSNPTISFAPFGDDADKTWLEVKRRNDFEREKLVHQKEKDAIYNDFLELKEKLSDLLNVNEECPENERLSLQHFNLCKEWSESLFEMARQERELEDRAMKAYVADQNRITQWIINNTWNRMVAQGVKIRGIFSSICCENYPLLRTDRASDEDMKKVLVWINIENMVARIDKFQPWILRSPEKTMEKLMQTPDYVDEDSGFKHSATSSETEFSDYSHEQLRTKFMKYSLSGTSTHNFIDPLPSRYDQLDVVTFQQTFAEKILGQMDMYNLRVHFNKEFNNLYKYKKDQMEQVIKRNDRLRVIRSELNILAQLKSSDEHYDNEIIDPEYQFDEQPEKIIKVENYEVGVAPYISRSRQKLLNEEAHQLELKRLAFLADDFRERALVTMMDGVLEKRWEDEIKKPPPLPDCLKSGKKLEEFSKDDIRAINDYEAQLNALQSERDKYRSILLEETSKVQHMQRDMITKFNMRCASLFMLKHQTDAAVKQEEIKLLRNSLYNYQRILHKRKEMKYMNELASVKKVIEGLNETIEELEKRMADSKIRYDQLQTRDKLLDKQFKTQFGESAPPVIVDQAYKIFKKRPKWIPRGWATAAILQDLANRVGSKNYVKSGAPLPDECYEFLALLESLENVATAPNSISPHLWNFLCQLRRHKIDSEFKLKAQGLQLAEAEMTLTTFNKELIHKKTRITEIEKEREEFRQIYLNNLRDRSVQLVMPKGLIEVPLSGHMDDFKGTVLVHESDIDDINDIIKKAGEIKLRSMDRSAVFRRKIIYKEWEHTMLQMELRNMQDYLAIIEKCKVTKEIQAYLKRKDLGLSDDLNQSALNREIEATRAHLRKALEDIQRHVLKVSNQLENKKRENKFLDGEIARINIDVTEQNLLRDLNMEEKERKMQIDRMATVVERSKLIRKVQAQHAQIIELATMLELQRLRTFPTLQTSKRNPFC